MLLVGLAAVADGLGPKLHQAIVQLAVGPVELRVRRVSQAEGCEMQLVQTARAQTSTPQGAPEDLAVERQLALARRRDGDQDDFTLQQLSLLHNQPGAGALKGKGTYKGHGIELDDIGIEAQPLSEAAQLLSDVLGVACLGAVEHESAAGGGACSCHGGVVAAHPSAVPACQLLQQMSGALQSCVKLFRTAQFQSRKQRRRFREKQTAGSGDSPQSHHHQQMSSPHGIDNGSRNSSKLGVHHGGDGAVVQGCCSGGVHGGCGWTPPMTRSLRGSSCDSRRCKEGE